MPPRTTPTARQRRLGAELRKLREAAGVSSPDAAALLGVNRTRIPNIESGHFGVSPERVRTLARHYNCSDTALVDALAGMAQKRGRGWWDHYRDRLPSAYIDIAELEHYAVQMRVFLMVHIPGLLQTPAHARALFERGLHGRPEREIEVRTAYRLERQATLLNNENPPEYTAIVHEAALRMQPGGAKIAREQLEYLLQVDEHDHIEVCTLPFGYDDLTGPGQPVLYAHGPVPQLDTVQLDAFHDSFLLHDEAHLTNYRRLFDRLYEKSLSGKKSRDFIHSIVRTL